ncbi:ISL3 family transposase [Methylobacterium sp. 17Sr1-1]|nr:ISL3 family transposase [Methylobacterium sp. 17Sr1-1]
MPDECRQRCELVEGQHLRGGEVAPEPVPTLGLPRFGSCSFCVDSGGLTRAADGQARSPRRGEHGCPPLASPECRVARFVEQHEDHLVIPLRLDAASGRCPECGRASRSVHSRDQRHPADLALSASRATLRIEVRRFDCLNPDCQRRTFAETPLTLLAPRARRTRRLGEAPARVGLACGCAGGARLLAHLHMPASRGTVLRLVTRLPMPDAPAPIRVGIDDWAIRKGSRYGTIVVDLDRQRVIDLLDRSAPTLAGWLERHSGVELVARDRSTEYARGASLCAPQAQQVADRWHLLWTPDPRKMSKNHPGQSHPTGSRLGSTKVGGRKAAHQFLQARPRSERVRHAAPKMEYSSPKDDVGVGPHSAPSPPGRAACVAAGSLRRAPARDRERSEWVR